MFPNKNWSLGGLKALMKKLTAQVLLFDVLGSGRPAQYLYCQFFDQHFQSIKTSVFVRKQLNQSFWSIFLIFL